MNIIVTGSEGLIGHALCRQLEAEGHELLCFDIRKDPRQDINGHRVLPEHGHVYDGVIHLAAMSRVAEAQRDPWQCWMQNVVGTQNVLTMALNGYLKWAIVASSREVYGDATSHTNSVVLPAPLNVYGHSKLAGEVMTAVPGSLGPRVPIAHIRAALQQRLWRRTRLPRPRRAGLLSRRSRSESPS